MEHKDLSLNSIFVVTIVLTFVSGFVGWYPILFWSLDNFQNYQIYSPIFGLINIIISPVLVFVVFYKIGKKFDLKSKLKSSIIRLLIGSYVGHFLAYFIVHFISEFGDFWSVLIGSIVSLTFLSTFFTVFTALAIAFLNQNN